MEFILFVAEFFLQCEFIALFQTVLVSVCAGNIHGFAADVLVYVSAVFRNAVYRDIFNEVAAGGFQRTDTVFFRVLCFSFSRHFQHILVRCYHIVDSLIFNVVKKRSEHCSENEYESREHYADKYRDIVGDILENDPQLKTCHDIDLCIELECLFLLVAFEVAADEFQR